jgi:hypothetical protein
VPLPLCPPRPLRPGSFAPWALGLLLALVTFGAAPRRAAAEDDAQEGSIEQLRERLLKARTAGEREGTLKVILERPADQVGGILGPLFSQKDLGASVELLAAAARHLSEHPVGAPPPGGTVLLADYIFRRAAAEPALVGLLRDSLAVDPATEQAPDWDRLVNNAMAFLEPKAGRPAADRLAAIAFLAHEDGPHAGRVVEALEDGARRLRQDAALHAAEREAEGGALLAALSELLVFRFSSLDAALPELERTRGWSYVRRLRHFSRLKTEADLDRSLALRHGREVIAAMAGPVELTAALTCGLFPYPEHQRALLERAARLKPQPDPAWEEFYRAVLTHASESEVVFDALAQLAEAGFGGGPPACCLALATALQRRLEKAGAPDPPEVRRRLVVALGDMAILEPVVRQVSLVLERRAIAPEDVPELVELVRAVGRCPRADAATLRPFYELGALPGADAAGREALRSAVARALGREGIRSSDPAGAVAALRGILEGSADYERAVLPKVREQAYRSLAAYPTEEVTSWLLTAASTADPAQAAEALLALETVGQMLGTGEPGVRQGAAGLAAFLEQSRERGDVDDRQIEALKRLKDLPAGEAVALELRERVLAAVRHALEKPASEAVRTQAARTAADLADPGALAALVAWWREQPQAPRSELLRALLESVVRSGREGDPAVVEALASVATTAGQESVAVQWSDLLARSAQRAGSSRPLLLRAQAQALVARAASHPEDAAGREQRAEDLGMARVVLTAVVQAARAPEEADPVRRQLIEVLERLAEALGDGPTAADRLVEAVGQAARAQERTVLQTGERLARRVLASEALKSHLSAERLAELEQQLEAILETLEKTG